MNAEIRVEGLRELQRELRRAGNTELPKQVRKAAKDAAQIVADDAARRAPRRSGRLAASIKASASQSSAKVKAGTASRVPYAGPIHYGWRKRNIRPNPFLYAARDARRGEVERAFEKAMDDLASEINR